VTHSLLGTAIIGLVLFFIFKRFPSYWGINTLTVLFCTITGYLSHLLADSFTVQGIPLLWPAKWKFGIPPKPFEGARIMTGKWFENLIIFPAINITLILLILTKWSTIKLILFK
jgi:membrane-bound metal-dependent hydrolase YbcI (DUF457 family)